MRRLQDVVSILISADFLQMDVLVNECLEGMYKSLEEIVALPLDLGGGSLEARIMLESC